jgi:hypothetical protein
MAEHPKLPSSFREIRQTLARRADWESTRGECARWTVFFACLVAGPALMPLLTPAAGRWLLLALLGFWIWWSLPFLGWRRSLLNLPLVLFVIAVNVLAWMVVSSRSPTP